MCVCVVGVKGNRSGWTPTHAVLPISPPLLFSLASTNERGTTGPQQFHSHFIYHSAVFSSDIHSLHPHPSLCPHQSLLSLSLLYSLPHPLAPFSSFHVVTHNSCDISPSVSPLLVLAFTPVSQPGQDREREVGGVMIQMDRP